MKAIFKILMIMIFFFLGAVAWASAPPPPPGGGQSNNGNVPGGGAPIGEGICVLIALSAGYGAKKVYDFSKRNRPELRDLTGFKIL